MKYSPSQLETHNDCALKHRLRYDKRLRPLDERATPNLASGRALHECVKYALDSGHYAPHDVVEDKALHLATLSEALGSPEQTHPDAKKYMNGLRNALGKVPEWVWDARDEWYVEEEIACELSTGDTLFGKPDLWRVVQDDVQEYVQILDIKTTDHNPLDYILWRPQIRIYAWILSHTQGIPITYQYLCVPTAQGKPTQISSPRLFTAKALGLTAEYVYGTIERIQQADPWPREGRHCAYCDYNIICRARTTGANVDEVTNQYYVTRESR